MFSPKMILLLILSVLVISAHSQNTPLPPPPPDTTEMKDSGFARWRKYLERNVNPNVPADNGAPSGIYTVYVQLVVAPDSTLSDIKPLTSLGYGMEAEVLRTIKKWSSWNSWKPAIQAAKGVNVYRKLSWTFIVPANGYNITTKVPYVLFTDTDNEITVEVEKVKTGNVKLIMPEGTITPAGDGKYIVRVDKPGTIIIELYNRKKKKKKILGTASFEVKDAMEKMFMEVL
jgi:hypothetical protein